MMNSNNKKCYQTLLLASVSILCWHSAVAEAQNTSSFGYENIRRFGGPDGVAGDLERTYEDKESSVKKSPLQSYYGWEKHIQDEHGFSFGFSGYWPYQKASESLSDEDDALGQIYRVQGSWTVLGRGTGHPGRVEYRIEHRSNIGSYFSPSQLGSEIGAAALQIGRE